MVLVFHFSVTDSENCVVTSHLTLTFPKKIWPLKLISNEPINREFGASLTQSVSSQKGESNR